MTTTTSTNNALRSLAKQAAMLSEINNRGDIVPISFGVRRKALFAELAMIGNIVITEEAAPPLCEILVSGARCDCKEKADA